MKRKILIFTLIFSLFPAIGSQGKSVEDESNKFKKMVEDQHKGDLERKEAILRKIRLFMGEINGNLKRGSKTKLDTPMEINDISDINDKRHKDYFQEDVVKKIYGYVNGENVNMRASSSIREPVVGKGQFAEKVEIVVQSREIDTIGGMKSRWVLVRKANGNEGWIFGVYISNKKPKRKPNKEEMQKESTASSTKGFLVPTEGRVSSNYGYRIDPVTKRKRSFHRGIDFAAPTGTPIKAAAAGVVHRSEYNRNGYGHLIVIKHEKDLATYYGHQSKRLVSKGQRVRKGEIIGKVGSTGRSTGPHLHFEVRRGRTSLNPNQFIR
jgi:murein DD-endopeptidase MepM/ murein hydrolase activator NlpD